MGRYVAPMVDMEHTPREVSCRVPARAGLLGNPSDVYGGRALAFTFEQFGATVTIRTGTEGLVLALDSADEMRFSNERELRDAVGGQGLVGGSALLAATSVFFLDELRRRSEGAADSLVAAGLGIGFESDIPRQVGLAGSSAIVLATLEALCHLTATDIDPEIRADMALDVETDLLGIVAGPMDRVIQSCRGFMYMDFQKPRGEASYLRVDPALLPPIFLAYDTSPGESSGKVHGEVKKRYEAGDPLVKRVVENLPQLADEGHQSLLRGDHVRLMRLVDENFDLRASIWSVSARQREMVELGREAGAAVKFAGSGGAVVGIFSEESKYPVVESAYHRAGFEVFRPDVTPHEKGKEESS